MNAADDLEKTFHKTGFSQTPRRRRSRSSTGARRGPATADAESLPAKMPQPRGIFQFSADYLIDCLVPPFIQTLITVLFKFFPSAVVPDTY